MVRLESMPRMMRWFKVGLDTCIALVIEFYVGWGCEITLGKVRGGEVYFFLQHVMPQLQPSISPMSNRKGQRLVWGRDYYQAGTTAHIIRSHAS